MKREIRTFGMTGIEIRKAGDKNMLAGHAALYDSMSRDLGGFFETIKPGAFARAIREKQDVKALWNHDSGVVLGRTTSGTLRIAEDARGLAIEIDLPNTTAAADLRELIERGDVDQMSFAFITRRDDWSERMVDNLMSVVRELQDVDLYDVSPVTFPAYEETDIAVRSFEQKRKRDQDDVARRHKNLIRKINLVKIIENA
jgi:HK97 family phage prohead protease